MSLLTYDPQISRPCFPRVSGDEPPGGYLLAFGAPFSPRERG